MEIITPRKLQTLNTENQRQFEGLLPELIKKLIVSTCDTDNLRIPHGEDIWADGFDGLIHNSTQTEYVDSGYSVWEFGTNRNAIQKINEDYAKRTRDDLGVDKKETVFYLVVPRIWNHRPSIPEWERTHSDWKKTKIYDASRLCDWINSEPAVAAWLLERYFNQPADFQTVEKAWSLYSQKTEPKMTATLFLSDRKESIDGFYSALQSEVTRVKADTFVEAQGFVLSALMDKPQLADQSIIVNDEKTYRLITGFVKNKLLVINYPCNHDLIKANSNRVAVCYNKEDTGIHENILLKALTKYHYVHAFEDMGLSEVAAHELYTFSHGNLRTLIRRIPGTTSDTKPEWANEANIDLLAPLLFMRRINRLSQIDCKIVELLTAESFDTVEAKYQELIRLEDSPIKVVYDYYIIVNYEEAWDTLGYTINGKQYSKLTDTVLFIMDSIEKTGRFEDYSISTYGRLTVFHTLMSNYIFFSLDDPESDALRQTMREILEYAYKPLANILCLQNLSQLAEASPQEVSRFLISDMSSDTGMVYQVFENKDRNDMYLDILFTLDELTHHDGCAVSACRLMFQLCQKGYGFKTSNSPEESLITALCFINTTVALSLQQKVALIQQLYKESSEYMSDIIIQIAQKDNYCISSRPGRKKEKQQEGISVTEYFQSIENICSAVLFDSIARGQCIRIKRIFDMYHKFTPDFLLGAAASVTKESFSFENLYILNYYMRKKHYEIKRHRMKKDSSYLKSLDAWIKATTDEKCQNHWLFHNYYDCPDNRLVNGDEDYEVRDKKKTEIRSEALRNIISVQGIEGVYIIIDFMEDIYMWGIFFAENLPEEYIEPIALKLLEKNKLSILAAILDKSDKGVFNNIYRLIDADDKKHLFVRMYRLDIDDLLICEEDKKQYWLGKNLSQYDENAYRQLLKYYPAGLLRYCYGVIKHDPTNHMDMVFEIYSAVLLSGDDLSSLGHLENYELEETMKIIDKVYYTDEWGRLSKDLYIKGVLSEITEGGSRYYIYNPDELIAYVTCEKRHYFYFSRHFSLPSCIYDEPDKLRAFAKALVMAGYAHLLGDILGLSKFGIDGYFPHELIRDLLEEINNDDVDASMVTSYYNNQNGRFVTDGSDLKTTADDFFKKADSLEISHRHTAAILRSIGEDYRRESKRDYLHSEIDSV